MSRKAMIKEIERIINESACTEEVWVTVEELFDDEGKGSAVEDAACTDGEVAFMAESFSTYVYASTLVTPFTSVRTPPQQ